MSAKVIDFQESLRRKNEPTMLVGKATCLSCKHKWDAEAPVGTVWLECPECSLARGRFSFSVEYDDPHWVCNCGNDLYRINTDGVYCPNCGNWQEGFYDSITKL